MITGQNKQKPKKLYLAGAHTWIAYHHGNGRGFTLYEFKSYTPHDGIYWFSPRGTKNVLGIRIGAIIDRSAGLHPFLIHTDLLDSGRLVMEK